jgi:winged helix DNA-binding protein
VADVARAALLSAALLPARLTAQLLAGVPARDPVEVVRHLLAVQGQDPRGARLAIRARSEGLTAADVDRALSEERSLLITWLNRGTLHLVATEDYPWLHALTTPPLFTANARRLAQLGLTPSAADRGVAVIERSLSEDGPLTRAQLGERIAAADVKSDGQALVHLLMLACLRGIAVRGPMAGAQHAYALVRDWLGEQRAVDRDRALAELARRYLTAHGPADERDLAKWAGLALREVRAGLAAIASELRPRADGLLELSTSPPPAPLPPPRLLGAFDPVLLGWRSREALLGANQSIVTINGIFRPFALAAGRAVASWSLPAGNVVVKPFETLAASTEAALQREAQDVLRYLGLPRQTRKR